MKKFLPPILLIFIMAPLISFAQEKTILLIESYHAEYPCDASYKAGLRTLTDKEGKHADAEALLKWTVKNTPVPPFAFWDFTVGPDKAIGGFVLFGKTHGEAAGKMALKILSGYASWQDQTQNS